MLPQTTSSHSRSPRSRIAFPVVPWHSRKAALPGASFETDEDGYCRWYSDGHDAFYITGSYTLAEDGLAYRDDGPVYAAGFDPIPYDPAEDWGDSWMSNWG